VTVMRIQMDFMICMIQMNDNEMHQEEVVKKLDQFQIDYE